MSFELLAIITLIVFAFGNLFVGVTNDAVNFLNSAIGARVAPRHVIIGMAAIGIIIGTTFSDGIIEVARKGIFFPEMFTSHEAIILFVSVALTDMILLDLYSTFGLPTSTTVSIVFELLGGAFILGFWKMGGLDGAWEVINTVSAMRIIVGILFSIAVAFTFGLLVQFVSRLFFTFDYKHQLNKWGFIWCGIALTVLMFFILIKGSKHATFMTEDLKLWIQTSTNIVLMGSFVLFTIISFVLIKLKFNILKWIVLIGTMSLAMAFAGNDLANFIGVSVGGVHAFLGSDLASTLKTPTWVVVLAGLVMSFAIFKSKKAKSVTNTGVALASHGKEVTNQWKATTFTRRLSRMTIWIFDSIVSITPDFIENWIASRWHQTAESKDGNDFDLIRASVNLMVAAAVISYATSYKLPLSTTYVTFMVAMGTSLADKAWSPECAPARINGVITVIGGWFVTAILAFGMCAITTSIIYFAKTPGLIALICFVIFVMYNLHHMHQKKYG